MDLYLLGQAIVMTVIASVVIMYACDEFEACADYLGRNMSGGLKGALINAIGSSLPELLTASFLLFMYNDMAGFTAGIATTAGSAVFNTVVIPLLCIVAVRYYGVKKSDGTVEKLKEITISKKSFARDATFLILAELLLLYFLGNTELTWIAGASLVVFYLVYVAYLMIQHKMSNSTDSEDDDDDDDDDDEQPSKLKALITFQFNHLLFGGKKLTTKSAWVNLSLAVLVISVACHYLAEAVMISAKALDIAPYFTAIIFAAAATSVPDAILSIKDARKGNIEDSLGNVVGSNIFDITIALGAPLLVYSLVYGPVSLVGQGTTNEDMQVLRIALVVITTAVSVGFLVTKYVGKFHVHLLAVLYLIWVGYIVTSIVPTKSENIEESNFASVQLQDVKSMN
ncbi:hypothetical protein L1267_22765 [Pseudoalteromonas sp. OFAV1]|jgi:cation:H+ antiporter|uniref:sodium:calcium antiporter n=1 Tax=Pseudoalteromonas sp. OFAV1 TaxID=2908892 RepID=UPI001F423061|nr:hypothetical protein [Pseudoalteromonas sp. OFAV1]MCF2903195.1 hypothetical protein [Pseudoalteromonas sp. OFAV1]